MLEQEYLELTNQLKEEFDKKDKQLEDLKEKHFKNPLTSPLFVLQSTDDDQYDDHINCVSNAEELADQADLVDVKYSGSKKLDNGMTRFMVIGR